MGIGKFSYAMCHTRVIPDGDRTGLQRHRDIGDLMRYAAMNQGGDFLASSGGWVPLTEMMGGQPLPQDPRTAPPGVIDRYSDEQLDALARYLYSLKPPSNPHPFDEQATRSNDIFHAEGCAKCHDPEQGYTNNKLIAAPGFKVFGLDLTDEEREALIAFLRTL